MPEAFAAVNNGDSSPSKSNKKMGKMVAARVKLLDNTFLELVLEVSDCESCVLFVFLQG